MSATPALVVPPTAASSTTASTSTAASSPPTDNRDVDVPPTETAPPDGSGAEVDIQALRAAAMKSAKGKRAKSATTSRAASPTVLGPESVASSVQQPPSAEAGPSSIPIPGPASTPAVQIDVPRRPSLPTAPHLPPKPVVSPSKTSAAQLDKEEGEISDVDEPGETYYRDDRSRFSGLPRGEPSRQPGRQDSHSPGGQTSARGRGGKKKQQPRRSSLKNRPPSSPRPSSSTVITAKIANAEKGKSKEMAAPTSADATMASAAADISPEEAKQYMDIIRNLIFEGFSPETLVERGATPKYVMAVCEEIVEGTKKRQALWLETREQVRAGSETPSIAPTVVPPAEEGKSPSPDIEVSVRPGLMPGMERVKSTSSESSAEYTLVERMSPPDGQPFRPNPTISWPQQHTHPLPQAGPSTHPVKIESYKPGLSQTKPPTLKPPTGPRSERYEPHISSSHHLQIASGPNVPLASSSQSAPRPTASLGVVENQHPQRKGKKRGGKTWDYGLSVGSDVVLNYGDEDQDPPSASLPARETQPLAERLSTPSVPAEVAPPTSTPPPLPIDLPPPDISEIPVPKIEIPITSDPKPSAADNALQNALLESRRKALESMRRRRAALDNSKPVQTIISETVAEESTARSLDAAALALNKSIEEQMADIEKEVMNLHAESAVSDAKVVEDEEMEEDMDIDEPEEGEIIMSTLPTPPSEPPVTLSTIPVSAPVPRPPRGVKRLHAEDLMENRSTSVPTRIPPPQKRRLFGAILRPQRLILHLDESSDSSDDEEDILPSPQPDPDILATQRLLAEKEESIRRLKEQIAAKMKARATKKLEARLTDSDESPMVTTPSSEGPLPIPATMKECGSRSGDQSPLPAEVRELKQELVQAEAEVEAMDVDAAPCPVDMRLMVVASGFWLVIFAAITECTDLIA
ncbi:hypothetical protein I316_01972 [Kwoniella heveanensis BCC8398]|uniref:Uncharacterized protein n=1 Tax=Kwoniella heveanensis BCC8398 TaxID=1296120 RepID=A0A1B9GYL5_9TREE|nr:hypothetical protein I316_01972 [Kwoniella heveanensis BCC8398]